jgi:Adenylate kinase
MTALQMLFRVLIRLPLTPQVVVDMVKNRLAQPDAVEHGWLLDGYPRSAEQAEAIEQASIRPDLFLLINVRAGLLEGTVVATATSQPSMHLNEREVDRPGRLRVGSLRCWCTSAHCARAAGPGRAAGGADRGAAQRPRDGRHLPPHLPAAARGHRAPPRAAQR